MWKKIVLSIIVVLFISIIGIFIVKNNISKKEELKESINIEDTINDENVIDNKDDTEVIKTDETQNEVEKEQKQEDKMLNKEENKPIKTITKEVPKQPEEVEQIPKEDDEQLRLAQEEAERIAAEKAEAERLEAERLAQEEARRQAEEAARKAEEERLAREKQELIDKLEALQAEYNENQAIRNSLESFYLTFIETLMDYNSRIAKERNPEVKAQLNAELQEFKDNNLEDAVKYENAGKNNYRIKSEIEALQAQINALN